MSMTQWWKALKESTLTDIHKLRMVSNLVSFSKKNLESHNAICVFQGFVRIHSPLMNFYTNKRKPNFQNTLLSLLSKMESKLSAKIAGQLKIIKRKKKDF